jgi:hypothetical protein
LISHIQSLSWLVSALRPGLRSGRRCITPCNIWKATRAPKLHIGEVRKTRTSCLDTQIRTIAPLDDQWLFPTIHVRHPHAVQQTADLFNFAAPWTCVRSHGSLDYGGRIPADYLIIIIQHRRRLWTSSPPPRCRARASPRRNPRRSTRPTPRASGGGTASSAGGSGPSPSTPGRTPRAKSSRRAQCGLSRIQGPKTPNLGPAGGHRLAKGLHLVQGTTCVEGILHARRRT